MEEFVPFGSEIYWWLLGLLVIARAADFYSTWFGTPNLKLEGNPLARKLGWRGGILLNIVICVATAAWPLPAIVLITTSFLVAGRNFQSAWVMRTMGEDSYRLWYLNCVLQGGLRRYLACIYAQASLTGAVGAALILLSGNMLVPFAVGMGIVTYAIAVAVFTTLSVWRLRG